MNLNRLQVVAIAIAASMITACDLSDLFDRGSKENVKLEELAAMEGREGQLVAGNGDKVNQVLKNGIVLQGHVNRCENCEFITTADAEVADSATGDGSFSQTVTQEEGIDESDRVKYDGQYLYIASNRDYRYYHDSNNEENGPFIRILKRNDDNSLTTQSRISVTPTASWLNSLFVEDDSLLAMYSIYEPIEGDTTGATYTSDLWMPYNQKFELKFVDVTDRADPQETSTIKIDGNILSSRRIGNKVYVLSSYYNEMAVTFDNDSELAAQQDYDAFIADESIQVLPNVTIGGETQPLVSADSCYFPNDTDYADGHAQVTIITTFDMTQPEQFSSTCMLLPSAGFYVSSNNLYIYTSENKYDENTANWSQSTAIHQFTLEPTHVAYAASGRLDGYVGWGNAHLRFNQHDGDLRVVVSENQFNQGGPVHRLHILRENNGRLDTISSLPNDQYPDPIGKPNEDIYAVRYFNDKAYVVTFERTDPLYVINLADHDSPFIEGALEIPGFSSYLQPLGENFIFGIGREVDPNANTSLADPDFISGAKVELYDVSNPSAPVVAGKIVYPNSYAVASHDYHALAMLPINESNYRFAFATKTWRGQQNEDGSYNWNNENSMQLVDVDLVQGGSLSQVGKLTVDSDYYGIWGDRTVLHGDVIYYIRNNEVWQSFWTNPTVLEGPY